jgi:hypothetical protein
LIVLRDKDDLAAHRVVTAGALNAADRASELHPLLEVLDDLGLEYAEQLRDLCGAIEAAIVNRVMGSIATIAKREQGR